MLDILTANKKQIGRISNLDLLTAQQNLATQLQAFLLSCQTDGLAQSTIGNYLYLIGNFIKFCYKINITQAKDLSPHNIRVFLTQLQTTNRHISIGDYRKAINRFFNWLLAEGLLEKSPMQNIKPPRKEERIIKPFSREDIDRLLYLCSGNRFLDLRNRAIILIFLDTGLRLGELASIQLEDIDFNRETIKVMGKGAKERIVRIGKRTQKALLQYLLVRKDNYTCLWVTEERRPLTKEGIRLAIRVLCHRARITDAKLGPHTFRHTFGTLALINGADLREVQSLLGHSTLKTTLTYVQTVNSEQAVIGHQRFSPVDSLRFLK